jgi:UDP-2,3-diacylglucosamine pyrophosphatase LpxH
MDETVVIISDLHLGQNDDFDIFAGPAKSQTFVDFMKFMGTRAGTVEVVINGDFVDFLQLRPWDVKVDRETAAKKIKNIVAAHKDTVFRALGEFLASPSHKVTVLLGNHDIELAFPEVWKHVVDAILEVVTGATADRLSSLAIDRTRITYVKPVGGVLVHIEHGNMDDPYNGMNYTALFQDAERGTDKFAYPPGTQLVYDIMNRHKAEFRFVDLLKPEVPAVPLLLMALKPKAVVDVPGIGLKSLAALGNGFIGWLRTKISGPTLGRAGEATPQEADENQLSKDIAAAYQDATDTAGGITQADAALLQQFFESSGEDQIAVQPVLGPSIEGAKKRLVQAAIRSLGRPVDPRDTTYYYLDHRDRDDVKWAPERLTGKVKVVVFGHTHRPLKTEFEGGGLYLNSGAWANQITLPAPADNLSDWMSRIRTNSDQNRAAFPTYITLTAEDGGATASLNVWEGAERSLWRKHIPV